MKLYSQHGHADGKKTITGLKEGYIDGVIYSPKDINFANLKIALDDIKSSVPSADRFFDPQVYASFVASQADSRVGHLMESYFQPEGYFATRRRNQFESEERVKDQLRRAIEFQNGLDLTAIIAPNIIVVNSCNSIEAAIAKNFIRFAKSVANDSGVSKPVYATLILSRDALVNVSDFIEFLSDITLFTPPPDGFYVTIAVTRPDARFEIFNREVLAGWMLLNHTLNQNGFPVLNGYSDVISPILGLAGAQSGATGWWSNLRTFSLDRFSPALQSGGSLPTVRYLSKALMGRISYFELEEIRRFFPEVVNGLKTDEIYPIDGEPVRNQEVFQSWQALKSICDGVLQGNIQQRIASFRAMALEAIDLRERVQHTSIRLESKSDGAHLEPLLSSITRFIDLAEIPIGVD